MYTAVQYERVPLVSSKFSLLKETVPDCCSAMVAEPAEPCAMDGVRMRDEVYNYIGGAANVPTLVTFFLFNNLTTIHLSKK